MARRFQEITEVYRQEIAALARADRWTAFLRSACRNYKLPFEEQVLVHAQRPDATAVLEIERWNRQFGRWVNKGATGIAVFDRDYPGRTHLKYYFDISDTHESRLSRPVPLWQVPTEQEPDVIEALENRFGALDDKGTLEEAIVSAMENAAADNMTDYLDDLQNCRDNSLLEELDELNLSVLYRRLLENSTAYMLMCRCGLEPDEYFDPEDFSEVFNFNTPETLNALGVATRDIAESGLSAIALTVRSRQKQIRTIAQAPENEYPIDKQTETQTERSENHGTDMLLSYDGAANEFRMVLKGKLSHTAVLGADAGGNVTRIDNALEKITEHLANARSQLAHTTEQLENARTEMTAPFPKEAELAEKTRRLNELNVLLNLNEQDRPVMADEPDEGDRIRPKNAERER